MAPRPHNRAAGQPQGGAGLERLQRSFFLDLRAANRSERTLTNYREVLALFARWSTEHGYPADPASVTKDQIREWLVELGETRRPATVRNRFVALKRFFSWLVAEGELDASPMANMTAPKVPDEPVPVLGEDETRRLLKTMAGTGFDDLRDTAVVLTLLDTGIRRSELVGMTQHDIAWDDQVIRIQGKGGHVRIAPFGNRTAKALDRYDRARSRRSDADSAAFWLGTKGPLKSDAIRQMLSRRGTQAGIDGLHAHQFRHTFAASFLQAGGQEGDLMKLTGWRARQMVDRYGARTAADRARESHRRFGPADRL